MNLKKLFKVDFLYRILKLVENRLESSKIVNNLFWGFNSILILFLIFNELFGYYFVPVIRLLCKGFSITNVSFYSILLYIVSLFAIFIGVKLKEKPAFKLKVLFGLEIPLLIIVFVRQEMLYELNFSMRYLFLLFFVLTLIYWIQIYFQRNKTNSRLLFFLQLRTFLLFAFVIYFSVQIIFSAILFSIILLKIGITESIFFLGYLIISLSLISMLIFVINPALFAFSYSLKNFKEMVYKFNRKARISYLASILILFSALYFLNINSKDFKYLALKNEPSLIKQKEMFFNNTEKLEKELRQSASESYYYLGTVQNNFFCYFLEDELNLNNTWKKHLHSVYNLFMYPFFYQDNVKELNKIEYEAENIYELFFDHPINEYRNYDDYDFSKANVHIDKQEINIKEYGDIAEIEICETYSTMSDFSQEIVCRFALPYNSVVTGLWISDDKNIDKKYPGLIAPSGAAQKVYETQVRKQLDPALLSQIGPDEYLLRAFPIFNKNLAPLDNLLDYKKESNYQFRLWYTYKTLVSRNNSWMLPKLLYKQNVYWSDKTKTFINGEISNRPNSWLPEYITAKKTAILKEHAATISDTVQIRSNPIEPAEWFSFNENVAFLIDGSYSMNKNRKKLIDKFGEIKEMFPNFREIDCFVVGKDINVLKAGRLLDELNGNPQLFFGNTNYMDMLKNFTTKYKGYANNYESIILISDISEYRYSEDGINRTYDYEESHTDTLKPNKLACPFIVIQLSDKIYQLNPNDFFNQLIYKSNGGFAKNKDELINLLNTNSKHFDGLFVFQDGVAYSKSKASAHTDTLFKDFATKEFINHYNLGDSIKLADIDALNEMAKKQHIVTKYSSMIALVSQEQVDSLNSAETQIDRFNNFYEGHTSNRGVMGLTNTFGPSIPKYPENIVVFMFFLLVCVMIFANRFKY